jgi:hypothetical protein
MFLSVRGAGFSTAGCVRPDLILLNSRGMVGRKRVLGLSRAFVPGALACVVWGASACSAGGDPPGSYPVQNFGGAFGVAGESASAGAFTVGAAGAVSVGTGPGVSTGGGNPACVQPQVTDQVFRAQALNNGLAARRELYSWTTEEQAAALRADQVLFSKVESEGLGAGYAFTYLSDLAMSSTNPDQKKLAAVLSGDLFSKKRYAWPEPWATRMGWPGEDYGNNLLRIVLKPEAWLVVVSGGQLTVFDADNVVVSLTDALASPQRLGAILYVKDAQTGGPNCEGGSFFGGSNGYREFILGNLAMVEEWSLGTQEIRDHLNANIEQLTQFLGKMRGCPITSTATQWNLSVVCSWNASLPPSASEIFAYEQALAIPSANYLPVPEQIAAVIQTLQGDLFEPDPLVVKLGSP